MPNRHAIEIVFLLACLLGLLTPAWTFATVAFILGSLCFRIIEGAENRRRIDALDRQIRRLPAPGKGNH